jgi:hypothetical protein
MKGWLIMPNEALPNVDELIHDRLEELLYGGYLTQVGYQEAILGHPVPRRVLVDFLEGCLQAIPEAGCRPIGSRNAANGQ